MARHAPALPQRGGVLDDADPAGFVQNGRRLGAAILGIGLIVTALTGLGAGPATASSACSVGGDVCTVKPDTAQTPLGLVTVTVTAGDVVTMHTDPTAPNTVVVGVPIKLPLGVLVLGCASGCGRTSIETPGGLVSMDTIIFPPDTLALPSLAILSIFPLATVPGPNRRDNLVFTPIFPPRPRPEPQPTAYLGGSLTRRTRTAPSLTDDHTGSCARPTPGAPLSSYRRSVARPI